LLFKVSCIAEVDKVNKQDLVNNTWLSPREAELYLKIRETDLSIRDAGKEIGMKEGQSTGTWSSIRNKVKKSKETAKLLEL
jgi:hypothetical protein